MLDNVISEFNNDKSSKAASLVNLLSDENSIDTEVIESACDYMGITPPITSLK